MFNIDKHATDAQAAAQQGALSANTRAQMYLRRRWVVGTASATTTRVRAGSSAVGTTTFNGVSGGRQLGGVMNSWIQVEEIMR
jgi:hypothetical protein